jgi:hypothetical protein
MIVSSRRPPCGTIRLKLLKIGALVRIGVRRIKIAIASACPAAEDWGRAAIRLALAALARASTARHAPPRRDHRAAQPTDPRRPKKVIDKSRTSAPQTRASSSEAFKIALRVAQSISSVRNTG